MDSLKAFLESAGFTIYKNTPRSQFDMIDWYAARRVKGARECETNDHKVSLVVRPHQYDLELQGQVFGSVECDITGEANGIWYKLQAYSLKPEEFVERLDEIEASLLKAWNSLKD